MLLIFIIIFIHQFLIFSLIYIFFNKRITIYIFTCILSLATPFATASKRRLRKILLRPGSLTAGLPSLRWGSWLFLPVMLLRPDDQVTIWRSASLGICVLMVHWCTTQYDDVFGTTRLGSRTELVERVLRSKMEWPSTARRPTDKLSGPTQRAPPLVLFWYYSLSLYLSRSRMTIWDRGAHASVDLCVCARYLITSQIPRESSNPTTTEKNWRGLIHLEAGASTCQRESNEKEGRYGQLWYALPSVFAGVAGTSSSSSGSGYKGSTKSSQCSFTRVCFVLSLFWI